MRRAAIQNALDNLAFEILDLMTAEVDVTERDLRLGFQCLQELPEPGQVDIEVRFDHAEIIIGPGRAKSSCPPPRYPRFDFSTANFAAGTESPRDGARGSPVIQWRMPNATETIDIAGVARKVIAALASHRQIPTFSSRTAGLTLDDAYHVRPLLRAAFEARGETIIASPIAASGRNTMSMRRSGATSPMRRCTRFLLPLPCGERVGVGGSCVAICSYRKSPAFRSKRSTCGFVDWSA